MTVPSWQKDALSNPELRRDLTRMVRTRAPEADVEDIVQAVLLEAIAAEKAPADPTELRKWVFGIARHEVADRHRRAGRVELTDDPLEAPAASAPHGAADLMRWVEAELPSSPDAEKTLEWMAREADGDKLEAIAAEEKLPAARVRQRVSRLRRFLRERWAAALIVLIAGAAAFLASRLTQRDVPAPVASTRNGELPLEQARELRAGALEQCRQKAWEACVEGLDRARALDPAGDDADAVRAARAAAARGLSHESAPPPSAAPAPSATLAPQPSATPVPTSSAHTAKPVRGSSTSAPLPKFSTPFDSDAPSRPGHSVK